MTSGALRSGLQSAGRVGAESLPAIPGLGRLLMYNQYIPYRAISDLTRIPEQPVIQVVGNCHFRFRPIVGSSFSNHVATSMRKPASCFLKPNLNQPFATQ